MDSKTAIQKAIEVAKGQANLAALVGVKQPTVSYWLKVGRVPAENVLNIEAAVLYKVTRHDLRPDIFGKAL